MPIYWKKEIRQQPAETLLLLDELHFHLLAQGPPRRDLALLCKAYPHIAWYIRNKLPELSPWVDSLAEMVAGESLPDDMDALVGDVMESIEDWIIYVTTPDDYQNQPFVAWDEKELTDIAGFRGKTVVDIGSGTGKQAFAAAPLAGTVYCVEPVWNLRRYLKKRAAALGFSNVFVVDGVIEAIPFAADFADVTMSGHVVGDDVLRETREMERVTKPGGRVILCPGNTDADNETHRLLLRLGYDWARFLEPGEAWGSGYKRKYWKDMT